MHGWSGRKPSAVFVAVALVAAVPVASRATTAAAPLSAASAPVNLIRDSGAEGATPDSDGNKVPVADWTTGANDNFTSVAYGTSGFPTSTSPGPRGAARVLVTLEMVRDAGEYVDGYADNLSLTVYK
jgi:hypothetical protein